MCSLLLPLPVVQHMTEEHHLFTFVACGPVGAPASRDAADRQFLEVLPVIFGLWLARPFWNLPGPPSASVRPLPLVRCSLTPYTSSGFTSRLLTVLPRSSIHSVLRPGHQLQYLPNGFGMIPNSEPYFSWTRHFQNISPGDQPETLVGYNNCPSPRTPLVLL